MSDDVVTKGEFAKLRGVAPSAVSNWLRDGKLFGDALVGTGPRARIRVAVAEAQLAATLDPGQQMGQGKVPLAAAAAKAEDESSLARYQAAKAEREELRLAQEKAEAAAREGEYLRTEEARAAWGAELSALVAGVEAALPDAANRIAAALQVDPSAVTRLLRTWFRDTRARLSADAEARAAAEEALAEAAAADTDDTEE